MEQALGVPLLERSSQGVSPTIYGEVLIERSQVIFSEGFLLYVMRKAFAAEGLDMSRATVTTQSTYGLSVLVASGPFLAIHPSAMLTTPNDHPQLTAVDVRLRSTRGPIGLITLKGRSPSPVAKLFLHVGAQVAKSIRPAQSRAAHEKGRR